MKSKDACFLEESYEKIRKRIKNQRHHFANRCLYSQSHSFTSNHIWMWELDVKKTECQRIDAFKLWCWRRRLRVSWMARRSNQSILQDINPKCSLEGLMLKQKLQYFGHLMWRANSLEKTLMLGKTEVRRREQQSMRWLDGILSVDSMDMSLSKLQETVKEPCHTAIHGVSKIWTRLSNWTAIGQTTLIHESYQQSSIFWAIPLCKTSDLPEMVTLSLREI